VGGEGGEGRRGGLRLPRLVGSANIASSTEKTAPATKPDFCPAVIWARRSCGLGSPGITCPVPTADLPPCLPLVALPSCAAIPPSSCVSSANCPPPLPPTAPHPSLPGSPPIGPAANQCRPPSLFPPPSPARHRSRARGMPPCGGPARTRVGRCHPGLGPTIIFRSRHAT
jgi:hypothetical protein